LFMRYCCNNITYAPQIIFIKTTKSELINTVITSFLSCQLSWELQVLFVLGHPLLELGSWEGRELEPWSFQLVCVQLALLMLGQFFLLV